MSKPIGSCLAYVLAALVADSAIAQTSGAIYTTKANGRTVDGNVYNRKSDVYLGGGPGATAPCSAAGLPDGDYYFQVTNPSGNTLLSADDVSARRVTVSGGVLTGHPNASGVPDTTGSHDTADKGRCDSIIVQLVPFDDTTNSGGEYKLWMTPVTEYVAGTGFHGFQARSSKTDNFKVKGPGRSYDQACIQGFKFYDYSEDGLWNPSQYPEEVPIPGWRIEIYVGEFPNATFEDVTFTDDEGRYKFLRDIVSNAPTTYTIVEKAPGGFINDEVPYATWRAETARSGVVVADASVVHGPDFGNISFVQGAAVATSKGFWSGPNGQALLQVCDPSWRSAVNTIPGTLAWPTAWATDPIGLCLRLTTVPSPNDPNLFFGVEPPEATFATAYQTLDAWINGNPALGHAAFILSTHVAALALNVECGPMSTETVLIDHRLDGVLVEPEVMLGRGASLLCNPLAPLTGPSPTDPLVIALRNAILDCTGEFNSAATGTTTFVKDPEPDPFASPYSDGNN